MSRSSFCVASILAFALAGTAWAGADKAEEPLRLEVDMVDGSLLIGLPGMDSVSVETSYAKLTIPLKQLLRVTMDANGETASFALLNGDTLKGAIPRKPVKLETVFGKVSVAIEQIRTLRVMAGGASMPAGEGSIAFGGLHWTPWRTTFAVQGDKLVTMPGARPGFNYGHSGDGRDSLLMSNIGSPDWKDYSVEFEYCMSGVDPAFNPHGLPLDHRSGAILFHIADAKESWNECGGSMYGLGLNSAGGWTLGCSYNQCRRGSRGHDDAPAASVRPLAEGQGLKLDPKNGNKFRIDVCGTRIQVWVDGTQIVDMRDEKMGEPVGGQTLDHGGIGFLWTWECMGWVRQVSAKRL